MGNMRNDILQENNPSRKLTSAKEAKILHKKKDTEIRAKSMTPDIHRSAIRINFFFLLLLISLSILSLVN